MNNKPECFSEKLCDYWALYFGLGLRTMTWDLKISEGGGQVKIIRGHLSNVGLKKCYI